MKIESKLFQLKTVNRYLSIVPFVLTLYLGDPVNSKIGLFTVYQFPAKTLRVGDDEGEARVICLED